MTVNAEPFPSEFPPHEPLYQCQVADVPKLPPVIPRVVEKLSQIVDWLAVTELATSELSFTVIAIIKQFVVLQIPSALIK